MALIRGSRVPFTLEDVAKMTPAVAADNLGALHPEGVIHMSLHGARDRVEIGRPATARLELVVCLVERSIAASAVVHALRRVVRIVLAGAGAFGAFLTEDAELLCIELG